MRKRSGLVALAISILLGSFSASAFASTPAGDVRVLLLVVDGNQPVPRALRHYENNRVTNLTWTDVSTVHQFAFEGSTSFASLFAEMSYGQMRITGDTLLVQLPHDASELLWTEWVDLANAEASSRGFDPSGYDRFLYILPYLPKGAPASAFASGATGVCSFITYIELGCLFHEFGHTIEFRHASELRPDGTIGEYGDDSDGIMGSAYNSHVNVVNKVRAAWLGGARLTTLDQAGTESHSLAAQSVPAETLQAVQIINSGARPGIGVVDTFVSFRDSGGFDRQLLDSALDVNGDEVADSVLIHQGLRSTLGGSIYLRALREGDRYDEHGVIVTVDRIDGDTATVTVTRTPYFPDPPRVAIFPENLDAEPGGYRLYSVSITNTNDPAEVSFDSTYDVAFVNDDAQLTHWNTSIPILAPGETGTFTLILRSDVDTPPGIYGFTISATEPSGDAGPVSGEAAASYTVVGAQVDTTPPTAPTGLDGFVDGIAVSLTWNPSTDDQSGVAGYQVLRSDGDDAGNVATIGSSLSPGFTDTTVTAGGTYTYWVRAFDTAGNLGALSASLSIAVPDTLPPDAPTGLSGLASSNRVDLSWSPATDNLAVTGYEVLRNGAMIASTSGTQFTDTGVEAGANYGYSVRAFDAAGNVGPESVSVVVTIPVPPPPPPVVSAPVNLTVGKMDLGKGKLQIKWQDSTDDSVDVRRYRVYRDGAYLGSTDKRKYDDKTVQLNTTYVYTVRAVSRDGDVSPESEPLSVFFGKS